MNVRIGYLLGYLGLAPVALLAACGSSVDPAETLATIRATEQAQLEAIGTRDLRGAIRNYQDEALLVLPRAAATGLPAIEGAFDALLGDANLNLKVTPQSAWAAASGDLAVTVSTGQLTTSDASGAPVTVPIDSQTVWRRTAGQPWQIASEYIVERPAPAQAAAAN
jgi:ketosteroid isomerase-like protein